MSLRLRLSAASSAEPTTAPGGVRTKKVRPITDTTAEIVPSRMKLDCQPHVSVKRPAPWGNSGALVADPATTRPIANQLGRASCREREGQDVENSRVAE